MTTARFAAALAAVVMGVGRAASGNAGEADVIAAQANRAADGTWSFAVTVAHGDTGWDHYANRWDVLGPDGVVLGSRVLLHPHETEQPFTRALGGVVIAADVREVTIRAIDSVHGSGGRTLTLPLSR